MTARWWPAPHRLDAVLLGDRSRPKTHCGRERETHDSRDANTRIALRHATRSAIPPSAATRVIHLAKGSDASQRILRSPTMYVR